MNIAIELVQSWRLHARIRELINEPGVQQLIIRNENGDDLIEIKVPAMLEGSTIRPMLAAVKAIADELPRVTIAVVRNPELARAVGETDEEFDRAIDVVEPVFERY
ncbi:DUF4342 domain-containing protein [Chloroflexus aggregans]|jgi:hypothetical protein|uniref:DUF4342 domain-containing protein n=1 Tax=Chloroflexus aggregans (strain MD-66 / DSM 9485) TaxID=326427 RepID=B8G6M7_CHLAD|nr:DUF4342 domain-containing protein [Chloroflexus aggregans]ACL25836.1 conserved hypothetical protein [Chloroflexus aggregans DSM 9485]